MIAPPVALAYLLGAYLLGSVPFSWLIARVSSGRDLRSFGSGNPGATNTLRAAGRGPAALALLLDGGKGALAVAVCDAVPSGGRELAAAAALAVVIGHVASLFLGLRGGKGVATAFGALAVLLPVATLAGGFLFLLVTWWRRYVSLASILSITAIPLVVLALSLSGRHTVVSGPELWAAVAIAATVVARHSANIRRLLAGTESRLGNGNGRPAEVNG